MSLIERVHGSYVHLRRCRILCNKLVPLIPPDSDLLDVGCGDGLLSRALADRRPDIRVTGIDLKVREQTAIPVQGFDGLHIPHKDCGVDVILFADVLHHAGDVQGLLGEACRVARRAVLIKDHDCSGPLAWKRLGFMDWIANTRHGITLPYQYWSRPVWLDMFERAGLTLRSWDAALRLYPLPAEWIFGGRLQFIAQLKPERYTDEA